MIERRWRDRYGRDWMLRAGAPWRMRAMLTTAWHSLTNPYYFEAMKPVEIGMSSHSHTSSRCYCPHGRLAGFRIRFFGFFLWLTRSHYYGPRPCLCNLVMWELFPEDHAEEIEDYGGIDGVRRLIEQRQKWGQS